MTASLDQQLAHELGVLDRAGLRRTLKDIADRHEMEVSLDGAPAVDFSSNDYLGLASDPRLARTIIQFLHSQSTGAAAARLISGNHPEQVVLEQELAAFKGTEAARLFSSGYMANMGAIAALAGKRDVIYADELNHASLIDASRLSRAEVRVYPHCDLDALRNMLQEDAGRFRRRLIVTDGMFSMDGDLCPLDRLVPLAREFDAWTYVDDAHGTGVLGKTGRGVVEHFHMEGEINVIMGTLGKSLGVSGAFIAGSQTLIDFMLHRARTFVFTTNTPPLLAAATRAALQIVISEPERRTQLYTNARRLREGLQAIGYTPGGLDHGYIIPVIIGDSQKTMHIGNTLRDAGFLVGAVRPPTVPLGTSRLRITVSAMHTNAQITGLLDALQPLLS